jgi:hypothetical protein
LVLHAALANALKMHGKSSLHWAIFCTEVGEELQQDAAVILKGRK